MAAFSNFTKKVLSKREIIWGDITKTIAPAWNQTVRWVQENPTDAVKLLGGALLISEVDDLGDASAEQSQPTTHHNYHN